MPNLHDVAPRCAEAEGLRLQRSSIGATADCRSDTIYRDCFTWNVTPTIVAVPFRFFGLPVYGATL